MKRILVDSNYLCHKATHAFGGLTNDKLGTGVIFGFINDIKTLAHKFKSNRFIFVWDSKESKRKLMYSEYKEKRTKKRRELSDEEKAIQKDAYRQFTLLRTKVLPNLGFKNNFIQEGYEGDDIFAIIVKHYKNCIMVTSDEDMFQLLDKASMYSPRTDKLHTAKTFKKEFGITPKQWVQVKQIAGCRSDNVAGISGVGEKTAIKYLLGELKATTKAYQSIIAGSDIIERNKDLVKLPLKGTKKVKIKKNNVTMKKFKSMCNDHAFYSFIENKNFVEWKNIIEGNF